MTTQTIQRTTTGPRIYVACLAAYNNGHLHGAWIDATQGEWGMWDAIQAMLASSPVAGAEEWGIHDYEGFEGVRLRACQGIASVSEIATFLVAYGTLGAALLDHFCNDIDEARDAMTDGYLGCHTSLADYLQEITEETTAIPSSLRYYIDWQAMARDAEMSGNLFTITTAHDAVHVFGGW